MKCFQLSVASFALMLCITACTSAKEPASRQEPALQPVLNSAPYICSYIPEQGFHIVTGTLKFSAGKTKGTEKNGDCRIPGDPTPPLEVWWRQEGPEMPLQHLDFLLSGRRSVYMQHGGIPLPSDLGDGVAAYLPDGLLEEQPYRVSAKFRCGGKDRMLDIYLAKVAKGRDAIQDLIALMRIAQSRYGELYDCTPQGTQGTQGAQSHSPQATTTATQQLTGKPGSRLR